MKYCPKCKFETNQWDAQDNILYTCPSCGAPWPEYLNFMADDALWPNLVRHNTHDIYCPKCGYERTEADSAIPRTLCPKCNVVYASQIIPPAPNPVQPKKLEETAPTASKKTYSFYDRDGYLAKLRSNSCYPTFRRVTKVVSYVCYFVAAVIFIFAIITLSKMGRYELRENGWLIGLGSLVISLVIAVIAKFGEEAALMIADAADAIVHTGGHKEE